MSAVQGPQHQAAWPQGRTPLQQGLLALQPRPHPLALPLPAGSGTDRRWLTEGSGAPQQARAVPQPSPQAQQRPGQPTHLVRCRGLARAAGAGPSVLLGGQLLLLAFLPIVAALPLLLSLNRSEAGQPGGASGSTCLQACASSRRLERNGCHARGLPLRGTARLTSLSPPSSSSPSSSFLAFCSAQRPRNTHNQQRDSVTNLGACRREAGAPGGLLPPHLGCPARRAASTLALGSLLFLRRLLREQVTRRRSWRQGSVGALSRAAAAGREP